MIDHLTLALTILIAGLLGGVINFFMVHIKEEEFSDQYIFTKCIFLGLGASALSPLFLYLIGSKLLEPVTTGYPLLNYYVIGGFCLAAAIYSKRFIEDIYSRIIKAEKTAKDAKKTADEAKETSKDIEQKVIEDDDSDQMLGLESLQIGQTEEQKRDYQSILLSISTSKYVYRTFDGLHKDTGINKSSLKQYLSDMENSGLVISKLNKRGNKVYKIST